MASPSMSPPVTGHTPPFTVPYRLHSAQPGRRPESIPPGYGLVEDDAAVDGLWLAVGAGVCVGDGVGVGDEDPAEEGAPRTVVPRRGAPRTVVPRTAVPRTGGATTATAASGPASGTGPVPRRRPGWRRRTRPSRCVRS